MLKKIYRLSGTYLKNPKNIKTSYFNIKTVKNDLNINRFAFIVSKKIDKRAVVRNRIKRKVRAGIEELFSSIEKGNDFVFYPKKKAIDINQSQLLNELKNTFLKQGLIKWLKQSQ